VAKAFLAHVLGVVEVPDQAERDLQGERPEPARQPVQRGSVARDGAPHVLLLFRVAGNGARSGIRTAALVPLAAGGGRRAGLVELDHECTRGGTGERKDVPFTRSLAGREILRNGARRGA
jgi:hypothetical protein